MNCLTLSGLGTLAVLLALFLGISSSVVLEPTPTNTLPPWTAESLPTLPPWTPGPATPPPTTAEPFSITIGTNLSAGPYQPAPHGPGGGTGCNAAVTLIVTGAEAVSGVFCVWNASYARPGDCNYPTTAPAGISTHVVTLGGDQHFRDHQIQFQTDAHGIIGPVALRCLD